MGLNVMCLSFEHPIKKHNLFSRVTIRIYRGSAPIPALHDGSVATIGNFDGVHQGHQMLLAQLCARANRLQLPSLVVLFEPQPAEYFLGDQAPVRLFSFREKIHALQQAGVDAVYCCRFNAHLASLSPAAFAEQVLFSLLRVKHLLLGQDFRFGQGRLGDTAALKKLGDARQCVVEVCPDYPTDQTRVSSTEIRLALREGNLQQAALYLGRPYTVSGRVIRGFGRGRQWGIPTANVHIPHGVLPLRGVFFVQVRRANGAVFSGVANVGCRPTLNGNQTSLEVHLLDMEASLYGERIAVTFLCKWRDEMKFASVDLLITQIKQDIREAKSYFALL